MITILKLTVSYKDAEDLIDFVNSLGEKVVRFKISEKERGQYKKAYIYYKKNKTKPLKNRG